MRRLRLGIVWWVASFGLWLLLDDTVAVPELVDGAVVAALAAAAAVIATPGKRRGDAGWPPPRDLLPRLARPVVRLLADLPPLAHVLWRALRHGERRPGALGRVPFAAADPEGVDGPRLALATYAGSLAPGTIVVGFDPAPGALVVHGLTGAPERRAADPLGLG